MINNKSLNYWGKISKNLITWHKPFKNIFNNDNFLWFEDGKLNLYENLILRNSKDKIAITCIEKNNKIKSFTFGQVHELVLILESNLEYHLKNKNNLRVMIQASASIESAVSMLMCMKNGFHFCVLFEDLELAAIEKRIKLFKPNIYLARNQKGSKIKQKGLIFFKLKENLIKKKKNYKQRKLKYFKSNRDLFTLFTSGSTGDPKGIVHSTGGYFCYALYTCQKQFGINSKSVILTASDAGWINGHTYSLIGPLGLSSHTILMETPMLLLNEKLIKQLFRLKVTILYVPVTIIRLMREVYKSKIFRQHNLNILGSMGEPLAKEVGNFFSRLFNLKKKAIINTYYQTETGGIICSPNYKETILNSPHGSVGRTINKYIKINKLDRNIKKEIQILVPWPGCMKRIINGKKIFDTYWTSKRYFRMFDLGTVKKSINKNFNHINIHGRTDDVVNIRGHRIGSEEIESIILKKKFIVECAAISVPDELEGNKFYLFLVSTKKISRQIEELISNHFGTWALPEKIYYIKELPKTKSGKILRRLLRELMFKSVDKIDLRKFSTMVNKRVVENIKISILEAND